MADSIQRQTTQAVKYTLIFKTLAQVCGIGATIFLVRALSEAQYGIYNLLYAVIGLLGTIASLGIGNTLQRYIPEYYQKGQFSLAARLVGATTLIRLLADTAILGVILLFWDHIAPTLKLTDHKFYFYLFFPVILLYQQRTIPDICLSSFFLHKYSKSIAAFFSIIKAGGYGVIILLGQHLYQVILVDLIANLTVFCLLQTACILKIPQKGGGKHVPIKEKKRLLRYAIFYNFNDSGVGLLSAGFDNFIIVMFMDPVAVGAYAFCTMLSIQITSLLPLKYFKDVVKPLFFSVGTAADKKRNVTLFFQSLVKINAIFALPCFFFFLIYGDTFVTLLFKGKFITYTPVLSGILFFSFINTIPMGTMAQLKERADIILYSKVFAIYNLIADIFLIKWLGIWGAVLATGTAISAKNLFIWFFVKKSASFRGMELFFGKVIMFWSAVSTMAYLIKHGIFLSDAFQLFLGLFLFFVAFLFQFTLRIFTETEYKSVMDIINHIPYFKKLKRHLSNPYIHL